MTYEIEQADSGWKLSVLADGVDEVHYFNDWDALINKLDEIQRESAE